MPEKPTFKFDWDNFVDRYDCDHDFYSVVQERMRSGLSTVMDRDDIADIATACGFLASVPNGNLWTHFDRANRYLNLLCRERPQVLYVGEDGLPHLRVGQVYEIVTRRLHSNFAMDESIIRHIADHPGKGRRKRSNDAAERHKEIVLADAEIKKRNPKLSKRSRAILIAEKNSGKLGFKVNNIMRVLNDNKENSLN